jgi:hypothetical protein
VKEEEEIGTAGEYYGKVGNCGFNNISMIRGLSTQDCTRNLDNSPTGFEDDESFFM